MERLRQHDVNTVEYWNEVWRGEQARGHRRLYLDTWPAVAAAIPEGARTLLDVGCGPGELCRYLKARRPELTVSGSDLSPVAVAISRAALPDCTFYVADGPASFGVGDRQFDVVTCTEVLEHVDRPDPFFAALVRHVAPGGRLIVTTPYNHLRECEEHLWHYTPDDFRVLARRHGVHVGSLQFTGVNRWCLLALFVRPWSGPAMAPSG